MKLLFVAALCLAAMLSHARADQIINEDFARKAMRAALPPEAECVNSALGPSCSLKTDSYSLFVSLDGGGAKLSEQFFYTEPATDDVSRLLQTFGIFAQIFGFTASEIEDCITHQRMEQMLLDADLLQKRTIKHKDFILECGLGMAYNNRLAVAEFRVNNEF
jgi:hypothetical protein